MKALVFDIRLNSLYSIRIPFTWQSALTYPVLPPSAVIGMLANALQRYKNNKHPLDYLDLIEKDIIWAGSKLLSPCIIKSYTTSAITIFGDKPLGSKFTNALGRQFAYTKNLQIAAIFKSEGIINEVASAVKSTPLTCGDSESPISIESEVKIKDVSKNIEERIVTEYPFPFSKDIKIIDGRGMVYLMHERCKKTGKNFPMVSYLVPIFEEKNILKPTSVVISRTNENVLKIDGIGDVIVS